jgi:hypothetical protein
MVAASQTKEGWRLPFRALVPRLDEFLSRGQDHRHCLRMNQCDNRVGRGRQEGAQQPKRRRGAEGCSQASDDPPRARDQSEGRNGSLATRRGNGPSVFIEIDRCRTEGNRGRWSLPRKRKKDGVYPFARLSLASTQCLIEDAVGRFAGYRKKDRGPVEGRSRTRGVSRQVPPRDRRPFPRHISDGGLRG